MFLSVATESEETWAWLLPWHCILREGRGCLPWPHTAETPGVFTLHDTRTGESTRQCLAQPVTGGQMGYHVVGALAWHVDGHKWCHLLPLRPDTGVLEMRRCGCHSHRAHGPVILRVQAGCPGGKASLEPPFSLKQALFPKSIQDHAEGKRRKFWG